MRSTFESIDADTQVVDRHDGHRVSFATKLVRFEEPESRFESLHDGCDNIARHFTRRAPTAGLMWPNHIVPSAIGKQLVSEFVNSQRHHDSSSALVLQRKNESLNDGN